MPLDLGPPEDSQPEAPSYRPNAPLNTTIESEKDGLSSEAVAPSLSPLLGISSIPLENVGDEEDWVDESEHDESFQSFFDLPDEASQPPIEPIHHKSSMTPDVPGDCPSAKGLEPVFTALRNESTSRGPKAKPSIKRPAVFRPLFRRRIESKAKEISGHGFAEQIYMAERDQCQLRVELTRSQKGHWHGIQAHLLRLCVEHLGPLGSGYGRLELAVTVRPTRETMATLDEEVGDGATSSVGQLAPRIVAYAPARIAGRRNSVRQVDLQIAFEALGRSIKVGRDWAKDEFFQVISDLHSESVGDHLAQSPPKNVMKVLAMSNPAYRDHLPPLQIALIVLSRGLPFELTAKATPKSHRSRIFSSSWRHRSTPVRFMPGGPDLIPHGSPPIKVDFGSQEMEGKWKELIPYMDEYEDTVLVGYDDVSDLVDAIRLSRVETQAEGVDDSTENFTDEALLRSYCRSTVVVEEAEVREKEAGHSISADHPLPGESSNDDEGKAIRNMSIEVTRAEAGIWMSQKAHFIMLGFEHSSHKSRPLDSIAIHVEINGIPTGYSLSSSSPLASTKTEESETSPRIVAYAPHNVRIPLDTTRTQQVLPASVLVGFERNDPLVIDPLGVDTRWTLVGRMDDLEGEKTSSLSVRASANLQYDEDLSALRIGLVVLSFGRPFTLSVYATLSGIGPGSREVQLKSKRQPAKFAYEGVELIPHEEKKIEVDFASPEMNAVWERLFASPMDTTPQAGRSIDSDVKPTIQDRPTSDGESLSNVRMTDDKSPMDETAFDEAALTDDEDCPLFADLDWSDESILESLKPREDVAELVAQTAEEKAAWDKLFADVTWPELAASIQTPLGDGVEPSSSPLPNSQNTTTSCPRVPGQSNDQALQEFAYAGELQPIYPSASGQVVTDKQLRNGLRINCQVTRIQSGTYRSEPAIFVGFMVKFNNSDSAHTVKESVITVRLWNVPSTSIEAALLSPASSVLAASGASRTAVYPAHVSPMNTPLASTSSIPTLLVDDPTGNMPGAYPHTRMITTNMPQATSNVSSPSLSEMSQPAHPPSRRGPAPFFVDHRPEHIRGPLLGDLETVQNNLSAQAGTPDNPYVSASVNGARQITRQHTIQRFSEIVVERQPHRPRSKRSTLRPDLASIHNLLRARASTNPYHQSGFKEIQFGTVVMTNARPCVMTVEVQCKCRNSLHFHRKPYTVERPFQIGHGRDLCPLDGEPIGVDDFSCAAMEWDTLVPMPTGFIRVPRGTTQ